MGFQLHLLFGVKEVFFFQFPKDPPLGLREQDMSNCFNSTAVGTGESKAWHNPGPMLTKARSAGSDPVGTCLSTPKCTLQTCIDTPVSSGLHTIAQGAFCV